MDTIKIEQPTGAPKPAATEPVTKPEVAAAEPTVAPALSEVKAFKDQTPCNWALTPLAGDIVEGVNQVNRETFVGTVADFNICLRM